MLVNRGTQFAAFRGEDGERITLRVSKCQSDSPIEACELSLECSGHYFRAVLDSHEVTGLADFLMFRYSNANVGSIAFEGEQGERLILRHSNMGEPYREGVSIAVEGVEEFPDYVGPFVESFEVKRMRGFIAQ